MTTSRDPASSTPSLAVLRERVHALEAGPEDVYALLEAMARPVAPDEDVPARAQALHRIIDDPVLGGLRDRDGRRVDETAVRALLALGEPYASELSEDGQRVLARMPAQPPRGSAGPAAAAADDEESAAEGKDVSWRTVIGIPTFVWTFTEHNQLTALGTLEPVGRVIVWCLALSVALPSLMICRSWLGPGARRVYKALLLGSIALMVAAMVFPASSTPRLAESYRTLLGEGVAIRLLLLVTLAVVPRAEQPD